MSFSSGRSPQQNNGRTFALTTMSVAVILALMLFVPSINPFVFEYTNTVTVTTTHTHTNTITITELPEFEYDTSILNISAVSNITGYNCSTPNNYTLTYMIVYIIFNVSAQAMYDALDLYGEGALMAYVTAFYAPILRSTVIRIDMPTYADFSYMILNVECTFTNQTGPEYLVETYTPSGYCIQDSGYPLDAFVTYEDCNQYLTINANCTNADSTIRSANYHFGN